MWQPTQHWDYNDEENFRRWYIYMAERYEMSPDPDHGDIPWRLMYKTIHIKDFKNRLNNLRDSA